MLLKDEIVKIGKQAKNAASKLSILDSKIKEKAIKEAAENITVVD